MATNRIAVRSIEGRYPPGSVGRYSQHGQCGILVCSTAARERNRSYRTSNPWYSGLPSGNASCCRRVTDHNEHPSRAINRDLRRSARYDDLVGQSWSTWREPPGNSSLTHASTGSTSVICPLNGREPVGNHNIHSPAPAVRALASATRSAACRPARAATAGVVRSG
jgi:hypothetical protein